MDEQHDEIHVEGRIFVSARRAAEISGYHKDYVGYLCRKYVSARWLAGMWFIEKQSILDYQKRANNTPPPGKITYSDFHLFFYFIKLRSALRKRFFIKSGYRQFMVSITTKKSTAACLPSFIFLVEYRKKKELTLVNNAA